MVISGKGSERDIAEALRKINQQLELTSEDSRNRKGVVHHWKAPTRFQEESRSP